MMFAVAQTLCRDTWISEDEIKAQFGAEYIATIKESVPEKNGKWLLHDIKTMSAFCITSSIEQAKSYCHPEMLLNIDKGFVIRDTQITQVGFWWLLKALINELLK